MKRLVSVVAAIATVFGTASPALAWNARGHMIVATIAWDQMTPAAKARAIELLRLNPNYDDWIEGVPADLRDVVAFANATTWPDDIRSQYIDDGYVIVEPRASQNIGYADRYVHRYWHFMDIPFSPDGTPLRQPETPNAVTRIADFTDALGSTSASDDIQSYDLVWLLHLVGDIHQPLHATSRFTASGIRGDNGGNGVKVCTTACQPSQAKSLHSFWDGALGTYSAPRAAVAAARRITYRAPAARAAVSDPTIWVQESFDLARNVAYSDPIGEEQGPYVVTTSYRVRVGSTAEAQAVLAGTRLARLLNNKLA